MYKIEDKLVDVVRDYNVGGFYLLCHWPYCYIRENPSHIITQAPASLLTVTKLTSKKITLPKLNSKNRHQSYNYRGIDTDATTKM